MAADLVGRKCPGRRGPDEGAHAVARVVCTRHRTRAHEVGCGRAGHAAGPLTQTVDGDLHVDRVALVVVHVLELGLRQCRPGGIGAHSETKRQVHEVQRRWRQ